MNYLKGSEWIKWDLQIQPAKNSWCFDFNPNDERIKDRVKCFLQKAIERDIKVIAITDHNFGGAIDVAIKIKEEENLDISILPGVELNTNEGWHILLIFNPNWKEKYTFTTWQEAVRNFLSSCKVYNPCEQSGNVSINITTRVLIEKTYNEDIGIIFFSHCLSDKGFFKRGSNNSRKEIIEMSLNEGFLYGFDIKSWEEKIQVEKEIQNCLSNRSYKLHLPVISSSDSHEPNEVSRFFTWIKANPTYEGLKQILYEPEERVFLGDEPEILKRVRENKTKFIKCLKIKQVSGYDESKGIWFKDIEIPFNPGLVAIIGNKGNGKSSVTDIIGLCGNSNNYRDFSFLKNDRFLKDNLAKNFEAELIWESEETIKRNLSDVPEKNSPERVKYLPQNFFEQLTNNLETYEFEKTLETLVFSYLPEEEKYGKTSFNELINYKRELVEIDLKRLKNDLSKINREIINFEKEAHTDFKKQLKEKLNLKKKELEEHEKIKPIEVPDPSKDSHLTEENKKLMDEIKLINDDLDRLQEENQGKLKEKIRTIQDIKELNDLKIKTLELKSTIDGFIKTNKEIFKKFGLDIYEIIKFGISFNKIDNKIKEKEDEKTQLEQKINDNNLTIDDIKNKKEQLEKKLTEPQRNYQKYIEELKNWESKKKTIEGDENTPGTIRWYEKKIKYIQNKLSKELRKKRKERLKIVQEIYKSKKEILDIYKGIKKFVDSEVQNFQNILGEYQISIEASFHIITDFHIEFLKYINQQVKGSFRGQEDGKKMLDNILMDRNIDEWESIVKILEDIINYLEEDKRDEAKGVKRYIKDQILKEEKWLEFYNFIFSLDYLDVIYELRLANKKLPQLSPGERGALLIVFYLLLDKSDIPLIIDQPEENLDNETVYKILTHFIKYAKKKRQLILVTHNPNLAIVGDAEQVIFVQIDKTNKNRFTFESGAIENPIINRHASNVLEGTIKAFDTRRLKYMRKA
jgi:ABC-type lipoprotein export system ATPase subunit